MKSRTLMICSLLVLSTAAVVDAAPKALSDYYKKKLREKYTPTPTIVGKLYDGRYEVGGDEIYLVATEFRGEFSESAAKQAFLNARDYLVRTEQTVLYGRYNRRLAADRHTVYGWYNKTRNEWGWIAFRIMSDGQSAQIATNFKSNRVINDWYYENWDTNGFRVRIQIADDDRGGVAAIFHRID